MRKVFFVPLGGGEIREEVEIDPPGKSGLYEDPEYLERCYKHFIKNHKKNLCFPTLKRKNFDWFEVENVQAIKEDEKGRGMIIPKKGKKKLSLCSKKILMQSQSKTVQKLIKEKENEVLETR